MKKRVLALLLALLAMAVPAAEAVELPVEAPAALLMEKETGQVLYADNEHEKLEPASVTKVMTLLLVMEAMEQTVTPGMHCLDLGSGSGILSITALRLGAESAVGVDIDPKAENIARENAAYNGFAAPDFTALTGNVTGDRKLMEQLSRKRYGLVLVNIVADVIIGLAPVLPEFLEEDTVLICSGILDTRLEDVLRALQKAGLTVTGIRQKEEWRCVTARKGEKA